MKQQDITIISIVEDQKEIGDGLKKHINTNANFCCDNHYLNGANAIQGITSCKPDVVIMDIGLPDINGVECMTRILKDNSNIKFIMFTIFDTDEFLFDALKKGASGYILKDDPYEDIIFAIEEVLNGGGPMSASIAKKVISSFHKFSSITPKLEVLTEHQKNILSFISEGLLNKEIADELRVTVGTIKAQITTIYKKLQVNNRVEASNIYRNSE